MQKVNNNSIKVKVSRFGDSTAEWELNEDATVSELLNVAGIVLGDSEQVYCEGIPADKNDILEDGDLVQIIGNKKGGSL